MISRFSWSRTFHFQFCFLLWGHFFSCKVLCAFLLVSKLIPWMIFQTFVTLHLSETETYIYTLNPIRCSQSGMGLADYGASRVTQ